MNTNPPFIIKFNELLDSKKIKEKWNYKTISQKLEMSVGKISNLRKGKTSPNMKDVEKISSVFGVDKGELYEKAKEEKGSIQVIPKTLYTEEQKEIAVLQARLSDARDRIKYYDNRIETILQKCAEVKAAAPQ